MNWILRWVSGLTDNFSWPNLAWWDSSSKTLKKFWENSKLKWQNCVKWFLRSLSGPNHNFLLTSSCLASLVIKKTLKNLGKIQKFWNDKIVWNTFYTGFQVSKTFFSLSHLIGWPQYQRKVWKKFGKAQKFRSVKIEWNTFCTGFQVSKTIFFVSSSYWLASLSKKTLKNFGKTQKLRSVKIARNKFSGSGCRSK